MAEWLGNGLQNRAQQFDSAWDLTEAGMRVSVTTDAHSHFLLYTLIY